MYIVRLEKDGKIKYEEFDDLQKAEDFTTLGMAYGWLWNIYKLIPGK